jgi:glucose/arabinose dehydrogenase
MVNRTGTNIANTLTGTGGADMLSGLAGADLLRSGGGDDRLMGGDGRDRIIGGAGDDLIFGHSAADIRHQQGNISADRFASGLSAPVFLTAAPGDESRLFVVEKTGTIRILDAATGAVQAAPFLTIPAGDLREGGEEGLLGLAFHPDYATNGRFFVYFTNQDGDLEIRSYDRASATRADPASGEVVIIIPHPENGNHNGGWLGFGPDGYLYVATGDGGSGGDPANNAQNRDSLLGKMLRLDVNGDDFPGDPARNYAIPSDNPFVGAAGADEIWAYGLRNPWRPSFDRETGDLYIADVGQGAREEINFQPAGSNGGENYGWVVREGDLEFDGGRPGNPDPDDPTLVDPVIAYPHASDGTGGFSVTGGYVYRGSAGGMQGSYLYADFVTDQVWSFRIVDGAVVDAANRTAQLVAEGGSVGSISSFGEDGAGNLFVISLGGSIWRLTPGLTAGDLADDLRGGAGDDSIIAGVGNDRLSGDGGADFLRAQNGDDVLIGGAGADELNGGQGADRFVFRRATDSALDARDVIADFGPSDRIDLTRLAPGRLEFIGQDAFDAVGQVRVRDAGDDVLVLINLTDTRGAEMAIRLLDIAPEAVTVAGFDL